jgi:hypothetical protein
MLPKRRPALAALARERFGLDDDQAVAPLGRQRENKIQNSRSQESKGTDDEFRRLETAIDGAGRSIPADVRCEFEVCCGPAAALRLSASPSSQIIAGLSKSR